MSKLNIDQKNIKDLFSAKRTDFLIPDYQRPYAWTETECNTLWEDVFNFAIPEGDATKFNSDTEEYFLGPIVTFKNEENKLEVIDGQQRLTTIMLLLRAFYDRFASMKDEQSVSTRDLLAKCIWKTDEFDKPNYNCLKIDSEVATDNDKDEFLSILKTGNVTNSMKSKYAANFQFFKEKIEEFLNSYASYLPYLPIRIMNNCILLPIEAESQDTALRIFSTLNDRGLPLSDSDIFKAQFYKYYSKKNEKDNFIKKWKGLEELTAKLFKNSMNPMDELFTRFMYFERAKNGNKSSTTEALRKFYEKDSYKILKNDQTLDLLIDLANFWNDVSTQDDQKFSNETLRKLFVLNYSPNGMWTYFVSVYYLQNKDTFDDQKFSKFLDLTTAFTFAYAITNPGVNALRTPVYSEMINIVNEKPITFSDFKFDETYLRTMIDTFGFYNQRPVSKSFLTWWAYQDDKQPLISLDEVLEIEHIYAKNRYDKEKTLSDAKYLDKLGNKALLEKRINIRASDYKFEDKKKYYEGFTTARGNVKEPTKILELKNMVNKVDFTENDIKDRDIIIIDKFISFVKVNGLIK